MQAPGQQRAREQEPAEQPGQVRAQAVLQVQVEQPEPVQVQVQAVLKDPVPVEQPEPVRAVLQVQGPEQQEQQRELTYAAFPVQMMQAWQTLKVREPAQTVKAPVMLA